MLAWRPNVARLATGIFLTALIFIVLVANAGQARHYFGWFLAMPGGDIIGHFGMMDAFSFLVNYWLRCRRVRVGHFTPLLGTLIVAVVVGLEEFSQMFVLTRSFSLLDLGADLLGIVIFGRLAEVACLREAAGDAANP